MTSDEFVSRLRSCAPSREYLVEMGIPGKLHGELISYYQVRDRGIGVEFKRDDVIQDLICKYDCTKIDISGIRFKSSGKFVAIDGKDKYLIFAAFDGDDIAIDIASREVVCLDGSRGGHVLAVVALNSDSFLEALLLVADVSKSTIDNMSIPEACAKAAGMSSSIGFYAMLVPSWRGGGGN